MMCEAGQINQKLCDFSQIGMRQAAATFSRLLGLSVTIQVVKAWRSDQVSADVLPQAEGFGIYTEIHGDFSGGLMLFLENNCARRLAGKLLQCEIPGPLHEEPASSTLTEIGNIICSAFLASLDDQLKLHSLPKPPLLAQGTVAALVERFQQGCGDPSLVVHTHLSCDSGDLTELQGETYLFLSCQVLEKLVALISSR